MKMKLLLTSLGVSNERIRAALVDVLGTPIEDSTAVCVATAIYALPTGVADSWQMLHAFASRNWREFGVPMLTALPTMREPDWLPAVEAADCLIAGGGNSGFLLYWMEHSGFGARLPGLLMDNVYLGVSAGSMYVTHSYQVDQDVLAHTGIYRDPEYEEDAPPNAGSDKTLGLVDFVIRPHLNAAYFPTATLNRFAQTAARIDVPLYAIDDQTALKVVDGVIDVISEGEWTLFDTARG
jgi:dipeptidase E